MMLKSIQIPTRYFMRFLVDLLKGFREEVLFQNLLRVRDVCNRDILDGNNLVLELLLGF